MSRSVSQRLTQKLIDWLIAIAISVIAIWFVITQPIIEPIKLGISQTVNTDNLQQHVQILTRGFAPRTLDYNNLNHTAKYIFDQFSNIGRPEFQPVNTISKQYQNVALQLGPDTQELYVIGAHYDAENNSIDTEGNASGVATLIELARHLAENSHKLGIGVVLVAYPISLNQSDNVVNTGSFIHAQNLKNNNRDVRLMFSLDSVGQIQSNLHAEKHSFNFMKLFQAEKENTMNLVGRLKDFVSIRALKKSFNQTADLSMKSHNLPESFHKSHSSDHLSYWKQGYSAVLISDFVSTDKQAQSEYISRVDPKDRLDYNKMASLINGLFDIILNTNPDAEDKTQLAQQTKNDKVKTLLQ